MDIIDKIKVAKSLEQLNALREEIHLAASHNEIDFKKVKNIFLKRKSELEEK